ncbi:relaxase domain-containing protein [Actinokineospora soli]|uniref:Relaxase domain-containing protein n=1 Tax=Actinokineospora soli TaxID=1048753 RepID=A0ABW2TG15_9PSEU
MLSISSGHSADYLIGAVAGGRENYYTGAVAAGEPPGRWYGRGAEALGLKGLVDEQDMTALYEHFVDPRDEAFKDPARWAEASTLGHTGRRYLSEEELYKQALDAEPNADAERREELRLEAGKRARKNVSFLDATFSVQKSVTVLHTAFEAQQVRAEREASEAEQVALDAALAGDTDTAAEWQRRHDEALTAARSWASHRKAVEDAIWAGNRAALDYLADKAGYSRVGHHGGAAGRFIDAHDWIVASFFQHDSRDHDPQLHIHNAILNRVQGADGQWRTLDSRAMHKFRGAASAVGSAPPRSTWHALWECGSPPARTARPAKSSESRSRSWTCSAPVDAPSPSAPPS